MDDYFDRLDEELPDDGWNSNYWDDCFPLEEEPEVVEPEFPVHSYENNCEACGGDRCYYADQIPMGFCEYHGTFDLTLEDGNCPECLAFACDWQAGAYVDNDPITCWE